MNPEYHGPIYEEGRRVGRSEGYAKAEAESRARIAGLVDDLARLQAPMPDHIHLNAAEDAQSQDDTYCIAIHADGSTTDMKEYSKFIKWWDAQHLRDDKQFDVALDAWQARASIQSVQSAPDSNVIADAFGSDAFPDPDVISNPEAPQGFDAEFISKRLARVAKIVGVSMPDMTHEQIVQVAGTILGQIAGKLERQTNPDVVAWTNSKELRDVQRGFVGTIYGSAAEALHTGGEIALCRLDAIKGICQ